MSVGVSYWEAINYTQVGINFYFLFWRAILLKKLCKFGRRGLVIVAKIQKNDYQTSEFGQSYLLKKHLGKLYDCIQFRMFQGHFSTRRFLEVQNLPDLMYFSYIFPFSVTSLHFRKTLTSASFLSSLINESRLSYETLFTV